MKPETFEWSLEWLATRAGAAPTFGELAGEVVGHLRASCAAYTWVGIYVLEGSRLRLACWDGPAATEHVLIPLNAGVCGLAATTGTLVNVPDVHQDDRYLQCFLGTRSEIVVPIAAAGAVYGEIDIDSDEPAAFSEDDERFLARVADTLAAVAAAEGRPSHRPPTA